MKTTILVLLSMFLLSCQVNAPKHTSAENATERILPYQSLSVSEFERVIGNRNTILVDVRTPEETMQGKVPGAIEINVLADDFAQKISSLNKDKTYLVYCRSGRRSLRAIEFMVAEGFTKLYNLEGGYRAWSVSHQ